MTVGMAYQIEEPRRPASSAMNPLYNSDGVLFSCLECAPLNKVTALLHFHGPWEEGETTLKSGSRCDKRSQEDIEEWEDF